MRITLLGTGNAGGIPQWGCACAACTGARHDPRRRRAPCSALVEADGVRLLLDAGLMDLSDRFPAGTLDAVLLTHFHVDHVQGLFHLRWGVGSLPVHHPPDTEGCADLYKHPGVLAFHPAAAGETLRFKAISATPVPLAHSKATYGWLFEAGAARIAYLTDTRGLPPATADRLRAWRPDLTVLDCTYAPDHFTPKGHNDLGLALETLADIGSRHGVLTHVGHGLQCWLDAHPTALPPSVTVGSDDELVWPRA